MSRCHICEEDSSQSWRPCSEALALAASACIVQLFLPLDRSPRQRTRSPLDWARIERCWGFEFRLSEWSSAITFLSYLSDRICDATALTQLEGADAARPGTEDPSVPEAATVESRQCKQDGV